VLRKFMFFLVIFVMGGLAADVYFVFQPEVVDAAGTALGRTTVLTSRGSNALFSNPAGLSQLENTTSQIGFRFDVNGHGEGYNSNQSNRHYVNGKKKYDYHGHAKFTSLSLGVPLSSESDNFRSAIAIGYRTYYDNGYSLKWRVPYSPNDIEYKEESHGGFNTISFGGGVEICRKLSLGIAGNLGVPFSSRYEYSRLYLENIPDLEIGRDFTFSGNFITCGAVYSFTEKMDLGIVYRSAYDLAYKFEVDVTRSHPYTIEYSIPDLVALSAQTSIIRNLILTCEYQFCHLTFYKEKDIKLYENIREGNSLHFAAEYFYKVPVRLGYFVTSTPKYHDNNYVWENRGRGYTPKLVKGLTAGTQFKLYSDISLDIVVEYSWLSFEKNDNIGDYFHSTYSTEDRRFRLCANLKYEIP